MHNNMQNNPYNSPYNNPYNKMRKIFKNRGGDGFTALIFLMPSLIGISVFFLIPFADTMRRGFYDVRGVNFIGLNSYVSVLNNPAFQLAAVNTIRFAAICIPLLLVLSLGTALLLRSIKPLGRIFKTTFLLPMAVPVASIVLLWQALFNYGGLANSVLNYFGFETIEFMSSASAFWVLVGTYLWKNNGYNMILWLAGLDGISETLYEAAYVDGASEFRTGRRITLKHVLRWYRLRTRDVRPHFNRNFARIKFASIYSGYKDYC